MTAFQIDSEASIQRETAALINAPRRNRKRFPETCVSPVDDEAIARASANPSKNIHAAVVYGPSVSSECQRVYHLIRWLD